MSLKLGVLCASVMFCFSLSPSKLLAQQPNTKPKSIEVATIEPRPEDVKTLDGIMRAFYETITGPAGQPRQWARDRTLYIPGVRFVATSRANGKVSARVLDHQSFVDLVNDELVKDGFYEQEIHRVSRAFGNITQVFSTYEVRQVANGPVLERGINSVELFYDGKRWWIASAIWDQETPDNPIPKELLP